MARPNVAGQQQREAYGALERAFNALVEGDDQKLGDSLDKVQALDGQGVYSDVVAVLRRLVHPEKASDDPAELASTLSEVRRILGPHPLISILDRRWPLETGSKGAP